MGSRPVSVWRGDIVLSLVTIAGICLFIALMTEVGMGEPGIYYLRVDFHTDNATVDPSEPVGAVQFDIDVWMSLYTDESYDVMLRIDDPEFSSYEFVPDVVTHISSRPKRVQLKVYIPDDIRAGTYEIPVIAYLFSSNRTYQVTNIGNVTIDVLENRNVPVEFVGGNNIPYYPDIPQIIQHLLLSNEGNTDERVLCRYLSNGVAINVSVWRRGSNEEVGLENPIELAPGEYVATTVVFFIDGIPDEDGMIPITIEVVSSEDGRVLGSRDSQVFKHPKDEDEGAWDNFHVALGIVVVVLLALTILLWRRGGRSETSS